MFAVVVLFDFSAVFSSGMKFALGYYYLYFAISMEMFFLIFSGSAFGFTAVFILWFILPGLNELLDYWKSDWSKKRYEYLIGKVIEVLKFILESTLYTLFLHIFLENNKDRPALVCFMAFLWILIAVLRFNHRTNLPDVAHILVYVFGSAVLSVLNSVALATEVFLKAEKGERTVEDLRVIVLPLESLFLAFWLGLQVYAFCMEDKKITEQLSQLFQSCKKQLRCPTSSQQDQTPQAEAVEMETLST
ncbi:uncharacterized protein LOC133141653 [Conger conger]|uniref:uncharacterized protein LOC133141653 n=1 Tax=Conger conger TaxID=82655 RepID=UPI002A5AAFA1|nr:uncharacterized protein LOC133141653 [Conger conger]